MAEERNISNKMDLSIDDATAEYVSLKKYLNSEKWVYSVIEKVERRLADLARLVIEKTIEGKDNEQ